MNDFQAYLKPTEFLDFDKKRVKQKALDITKSISSTEGCRGFQITFILWEI
jgi:hypothetical protein